MLEIDEPTTAPTMDELWRAHAAELVRFATVLVGPADAHDIVVEAFLRSYGAVTTGRVTRPRAYLFRAVANHANDLRRTRSRRWARDLSAVGPAATAGPDTFLDVRRAVAGLSVQQRAVVYFAYWEDMPEREIATVLGVSPGTVRRHLVRARLNLRKALR
ncbi:MAG: sigma-70 family RNA polymerase sigma factor [Ilumatobacteraceae bacterium]